MIEGSAHITTKHFFIQKKEKEKKNFFAPVCTSPSFFQLKHDGIEIDWAYKKQINAELYV